MYEIPVPDVKWDEGTHVAPRLRRRSDSSTGAGNWRRDRSEHQERPTREKEHTTTDREALQASAP